MKAIGFMALGSILTILLAVLTSSNVATQPIQAKPACPNRTAIVYNSQTALEYVGKGFQVKDMEISNSGQIVFVLEKY